MTTTNAGCHAHDYDAGDMRRCGVAAHPLQLLRQLAVADQQDVQRHALPKERLPPALDFGLSQESFRLGSLPNCKDRCSAGWSECVDIRKDGKEQGVKGLHARQIGPHAQQLYANTHQRSSRRRRQ